MRTIEQLERKYTLLIRARGAYGAGPVPLYVVKMRLGHQRFQVFPEPLEAETARWMRRNLATALYWLIATETKKEKKTTAAAGA